MTCFKNFNSYSWYQYIFGKLVDRNGENLRLITYSRIRKATREHNWKQHTFYSYCIDFYYLKLSFFVKFCVQFQGWENQFDPVLMMSVEMCRNLMVYGEMPCGFGCKNNNGLGLIYSWDMYDGIYDDGVGDGGSGIGKKTLWNWRFY